MLRYKQLVNSMVVTEHRNTVRHNNVMTTNNNKILSPEDCEKLKNIDCPKGCKAVVLPFCKSSGVGKFKSLFLWNNFGCISLQTYKNL